MNDAASGVPTTSQMKRGYSKNTAKTDRETTDKYRKRGIGSKQTTQKEKT